MSGSSLTEGGRKHTVAPGGKSPVLSGLNQAKQLKKLALKIKKVLVDYKVYVTNENDLQNMKVIHQLV